MFEELKKTYRPEFINRISEKVVFQPIQRGRNAAGGESVVKPSSRPWPNKGMTLRIPAFHGAQVASNQEADPEMRLATASCLADRSGRSAELLLSQAQKGQTIKVGTTAGTIKFELSRRMSYNLSAISHIL